MPVRVFISNSNLLFILSYPLTKYYL